MKYLCLAYGDKQKMSTLLTFRARVATMALIACPA